jgi:hypothetical protein
MPITREGEFLVTRKGDTPHIGLESKALPACIAEARRACYKGVFGSPYFGFDERTLNALHDLPDLESIWFWDVALEDVQAVYGLKSLRALGIHPDPWDPQVFNQILVLSFSGDDASQVTTLTEPF